MSKSPKSRKERIVECALKTYVERGATEVSIAEIAKRAKVPTSLVHYYFPKFEDLLIELMGFAVRALRDHVAGALESYEGPAQGKIFAYLRAHFDWARDNPGLFSIWLYFFYESSRSERARALHGEFRQAGRDRIAGMIYEGIVEGAFKLAPDHDVRSLALEIQALSQGAWTLPATETQADVGTVTELAIARVAEWLGVRPGGKLGAAKRR